jgi:myo-inositol-1(or 4)-monophosphatase
MTVEIDNEKILAAARQAALETGGFLKKCYGRRAEVEFKGDVNLVTRWDRESQEIIHKIIKDNFPGHSILGEEDLNVEKDKELLWLIDPIDGTTNFAHSLPMFCVSIAFMVRGGAEVGVVYVPVLDEMFYACRGGGAFLNGERIQVSAETDLGKSLLATGFPYDRRESADNNVDNFNKFIVKARGIRRMGAAAIDIAYAAAGRFEGFWELKLFPWDTAAAFLMVEEAGGKVTDFSGNPFDPFMKEIVVSNGHIHQQMLDILKSKPV